VCAVVQVQRISDTDRNEQLKPHFGGIRRAGQVTDVSTGRNER
jgi:hypothetical protein